MNLFWEALYRGSGWTGHGIILDYGDFKARFLIQNTHWNEKEPQYFFLKYCGSFSFSNNQIIFSVFLRKALHVLH